MQLFYIIEIYENVRIISIQITVLTMTGIHLIKIPYYFQSLRSYIRKLCVTRDFVYGFERRLILFFFNTHIKNTTITIETVINQKSLYTNNNIMFYAFI